MRSALLTLLFLAGAYAAQAIDVTLSFTAPTCFGYTDGTATATPGGGTGPYAFAWNNGQSGETVLGISAGVYTVTVTDQTGATATGSVTVTQPSALTVQFTQPAANCSAYQPVTAVVSGGTSPYSYNWSTGSTAAVVTPTGSGNIFITVTDAAGCALVETYYVPVASQIFTSYFAAPPTCAGGTNGSITPNIVGNYTPHTWVWSTGTNSGTNLTGVASGNYSITITDQQGCTKVDQINVPSQAPVGVFPLMTAAKCNGTPSGVGTAIGSGGVSPYTYVWSNNSTGQIIENLVAGNYTVTVTDGNGCSASATGTVNQPAPLTNTVVSITPACGNNGSVTVMPAGGTPPYNVVWNGGQYTGTTVNGLAPGTYYVCTFDANNCQLDIIVEVPGGPGLAVNIMTEKASCVGINDGTATAIVTGGSGNYLYTWSNGAPNYPQQTGLASGTTVTVTVTDLNSNCVGTATATIATHTQITVQVTDTDVFCPNDATGTASANAISGTAPYVYSWTVNGAQVNQQNLTGLTAGAYPVTVTDATGCQAFGVADINATGAAQANLSVETAFCEGDSVALLIKDLSLASGNTIVSWQWVVGWNTGSASFSGQQLPLVFVPANSTGTVQLSVVTTSGCEDKAAVSFTVGEDVKVTIDGGGTYVNCTGGPSTIKVTGEPTYNYAWSPAAGIVYVNNDPRVIQVNPPQNTTYQVVASSNGCSDTLLVTVIKSTLFEVDLGTPVITTCDTTQSLSPTLNIPLNNMNVVWVNAAGDSIASGNTFTVPATSTPVTYGVIVTDQNGCSDSDVVSVVSTAVDIQAEILPINLACSNVSLQAGVVNLDPADILVYNWTISPAGATISDPVAPNPTITGAAGTYTLSVTLTNQHGCTKTLTTPVNFLQTATLGGQMGPDICNGLVVDFDNNNIVSGTWSFGDGNTSTELSPVHEYAAAGQYIVSFTPNDACYQPFKDTIQVYTVPAVVAGIQSALLNCENTATVGFTDATQHVTDIASWTWNFSTGQTSNQQNPTITIPTEGTVTATLIVQDINGCSDTSDVLTLDIDIINDDIQAETGFCPGGSTELNPSSNNTYNYNWTASPADAELIATSSNPTVSPDITTVYSVAIVNGNCTVEKTVTVEVYEPADVLASRDTVVCSNNNVSISAYSSNAVSFAWSTNTGFNPIFATGNVATVTPGTVGMNYVRATNAQGCTAVDSTMVLLGTPVVVASTLDPLYICNGISAEIAVINNKPGDFLSYAWNNNLPANPSHLVQPASATTYTVVVTNQYGCSETLSFAVAPVGLVLGIDVTGKTTICPGESTVIAATTTGGTGYTYSWTPVNTLDNAEIAAPTASPVETTDYTVTVTDVASQCTIVGTTTISVISPECIDPFIFVPSAFTPNDDSSNDYFRVRGVNMTEVYFVVWNRWGEKMYETEEVNHQGWDGSLNGQKLSPDSYAWYARVRCGNGQFWEKKGNVTLIR